MHLQLPVKCLVYARRCPLCSRRNEWGRLPVILGLDVWSLYKSYVVLEVVLKWQRSGGAVHYNLLHLKIRKNNRAQSRGNHLTGYHQTQSLNLSSPCSAQLQAMGKPSFISSLLLFPERSLEETNPGLNMKALLSHTQPKHEQMQKGN